MVPEVVGSIPIIRPKIIIINSAFTEALFIMYNLNMINKQIIISSITVLVGLGLLSFAFWGQPPVSRDPNIGAGILFLLGIVVAACGIVWLVVELIKAVHYR